MRWSARRCWLAASAMCSGRTPGTCSSSRGIVVAVRSSWRNTDPRAVKAVALVVHEIAPKAKITVGEGPGAWMKEARPEVKHWELTIADGFETEGYYAAFEDPRLADAEIEFVDLNFAEPRLVKVPGGGWARDEYWIAAPVLEADVAITVPRIKTHCGQPWRHHRGHEEPDGRGPGDEVWLAQEDGLPLWLGQSWHPALTGDPGRNDHRSQPVRRDRFRRGREFSKSFRRAVG